MLTYTAMGTYVLAITLAALFMAILLVIQQRTKKNVAVWLLSGLFGILFGAAGFAAIVQLAGYDLARVPVILPPTEEDMALTAGMDQLAPGGSGMGGGPGGGLGGGPGGGPGGGFGGRGPSPKRQLTTIVRKMDLLTSDIDLRLSDEQVAAIVEALGRIKSKETMSDEEATALHEELSGLLDEDQQAKQEAIGLPFRRRGGGGGFGGGGERDESENPFTQEQNATALDALLQRFGAGETSSSEATPEAKKPGEAEQ